MRDHSMRSCFVSTTLATSLALLAHGCGGFDAAEPDGSGGTDDVAASEQAVTYPWPLYSVVPIFFVPRDWSTTSTEGAAERAASSSAMADVRAYYQTKLGRTFTLNSEQLVQANGFKEAYGITWTPGRNIYIDSIQVSGAFEGAVASELHARGYPTPPDQNESGYSAMLFVKGAGGWAGGREVR